MEEENINIEKFDIINPPETTENKMSNEPEEKEQNEEKKKKCSYFPSAYTILIVLEFVFFILTYIIPKGKFNTIEYDADSGEFILNIYNRTNNPETVNKPATKETLDELGINIPLDNFKNGNIKKAIAIPNSYNKLEDEENSNFFDLFTLPIYGMIESADIAFILIMIGGCINLLVEMNSLKSGMEALGRITKGHEIILLISAFILISIGGTTFGMCEEILSFYPVLMPIFLKSGIDGALAGASLYYGSVIGSMFSTINPFAVVIGSYSAGINFIDGIVLRVIGYIIGDAIVIAYFIFYHKRVKAEPSRSAVFDIKDELMDKYLKKEEKQNEDNEIKINDEETPLKELNENKPSKFTLIQKISLILFGLSFVLLIIGVSALDWWFEQLSAIFLFLGVILMFLLRQGETKAIDIFTKGGGDFVGVILIIGLARGINVTLEQGLISDTILNGLSKMVDGLPKVIFAIIMFIVFIILGFFFESSSGLAVLSMPIFAPLADKVNCSRTVVVNAYMFGQNFISLITPAGMVLIVSQLVGLKYSHWVKFSWIIVIILFIYLVIIIIISSLVD